MMTELDTFLDEHPEWREHADLVAMPPTVEDLLDEVPDAAGAEICAHVDTYTHFGVTRAAIYLLARRRGQSHRFAEMVAMQRPPRPDTDDIQFAGIPRVHQQHDDWYMRDVLARAAQLGYRPPDDAVYHAGLARFSGDPEAFVTPDMGRRYIRDLCTSRGWAAEGDVEVAARAPEQDPMETRVPLADDLVRRGAANLLRADPGLRRLSRQELRQRVIDKYGPSS